VIAAVLGTRAAGHPGRQCSRKSLGRFREHSQCYTPAPRREMIAKVRDNSELVKITNALKYEVQMLNDTSRILSSFDELYGDFEHSKTIRNALVESFTVHARVILDFLYSGKKKVDDVVALDFFDDAMIWRKARPKRSKLLKDIHWRVGKEIVHLSFERMNVRNKKWSLNIATELLRVVKIFYENAPSNRVSTQFTQYVNRLP